MAKKRVLMIAPYSFPVSGAESIVNIKLLKVLTESGQFEIDLVSRKIYTPDYPSGRIEDYGIELRSIHIITVYNRINLRTIWQHIGCFLRFGYIHKGCHWTFAAFDIVKKLIKQNKYDYVLTKCDCALGNYAKKKGLKWVATWNDPYPSSKYPAPYGLGIDGKTSLSDKVLIRMMRNADAHIFPSDRLAKYMQPIINATADKIFIIPHVVIMGERGSASGKSLRLIHSGSLYAPRSPKTFLEGLKLFISKEEKPLLKVSILGGISEEDKRLINELGVDSYVECFAPVEYQKSLKELNNYDVAVIIEAICKEGIYLPTKVSDFMQMQIPIFSISPAEGTLNDLFKKGNVPYFADVSDPESISSAISKVYRDFKDKTIKDNTIPKTYLPGYVVEQYAHF